MRIGIRFARKRHGFSQDRNDTRARFAGRKPDPGKWGKRVIAPMRVLIVEDSEELADLLAKGLRAAGYQIDLLTNLADATSALGTTRYAALILDLGLPDGDGLSILRELRHRKDPLPVLVLTARGGVEDRVSGLRSGADDYLVKPFPLTSWWRGSKRCSDGRGNCSAAHCGLPT